MSKPDLAHLFLDALIGRHRPMQVTIDNRLPGSKNAQGDPLVIYTGDALRLTFAECDTVIEVVRESHKDDPLAIRLVLRNGPVGE